MAAQSNYTDGYVDVSKRALAFFAKYPEGSLRPVKPDKPFEIIYLDDDRAQAYTTAFSGRDWASTYQPTMFICYTAAAYRYPDDPMPGIGVAWEPFPGLTPYTHNSEVMNCLHPDTELLTPEGWIQIGKLRHDRSTVAVYDPDKDVVSFTGDWQFIDGGVASRWIRIENNLSCQVVTANHRVLTTEGTFRADMLPSLPRRGGWKPVHGASGVVWATDTDVLMARLLAWVIADGTVGDYGQVTFGFLKERKPRRLCALLDQAGITYRRTKMAARDVDTIYIGARQMERRGLFHKSLTIPMALDLGADGFDAFVEEYKQTDGCEHFHGGMYLRTTDRNLVETLATVGPLRGWDATSLAFDDPPGPFPNSKPIHRIRLRRGSRPNRPVVTTISTDLLPAQCVSTPTGYIVTRFDGKTTITGNCETSAWGRAIVAVGAAEAKASNHEILLRRAEQAPENAASGTMSAAAAKSGIMQATAKHVAAAAWKAMDLPSGRSVRISREDYDACLNLAEDLMGSTDAFAETSTVDEAAVALHAGADTPATGSDAADGS